MLRDGCASTSAALPSGESPDAPQSVIRKIAAGGRSFYLCVPPGVSATTPVIVVVHGISRNALAHARAFAPLADAHDAVLVAPRFGRKRFPDYQRLGRAGRGERADLALIAMLEEVGRITHACTNRVFLFGYSGGGQFVHRFALVHPQLVAAYVVGAAGWYTFPDPAIAFPRGARATRTLPDVAFDLDGFLRVPATVLVGENDVEQGTSLRMTGKVVAQQGASRVERGQRWVDAMRAACAERGIAGRFSYRTLPAATHAFSEAAQYGGIAERAVESLLGRCRIASPIAPGRG